jgi:hypothetical protein
MTKDDSLSSDSPVRHARFARRAFAIKRLQALWLATAESFSVSAHALTTPRRRADTQSPRFATTVLSGEAFVPPSGGRWHESDGALPERV